MKIKNIFDIIKEFNFDKVILHYTENVYDYSHHDLVTLSINTTTIKDFEESLESLMFDFMLRECFPSLHIGNHRCVAELEFKKTIISKYDGYIYENHFKQITVYFLEK